jgi:asparagine synthase (glutamine-hydrolysing)
VTALAGYWSFDGQSDSGAAVAAMLAAQSSYGPQGQSVHAAGAAALGRGLYPLTDEDRFDRQPLVHGDGWMMVADVRIDNRDELRGPLATGPIAAMSDSELAFHAYAKWGERLVDHVIGDYALAVWDPRAEQIVLIRDPTGQRPLHFHRGDTYVAFASMPSGLHALADLPKALDRDQLAEFVADIPRSGTTTFFEGVARVEPGHIATLTRGGARSRNYWHMPTREIRFARQADYVEAFREQLDRATRARLRGAGPLVGAHLSAGLDSSAIAATAARLLGSEGGVLALTSAPRAGFDGPVPRGRIADESALAGATAALYPNMEHRLVRSDGLSPLTLLKRDPALFQEPMGLPCNQVWWTAVNDAARARGVRVMLTGEFGNLSLTAGGVAMLSEFLRTGRWWRWLREATAFRGSDGPRWRGILASSFAPWVPARLWRAITRAAQGPNVASEGVQMLRPELRGPLVERAFREGRNGRPERDERMLRWRILQGADPGSFRKATLGRWGIDERDPTADRRLVEFCIALPPEQFLSGGVTRRLAREALADRLPPAVLNGPRGYQGADWFEWLDPADIRATLAELEAGDQAELLDFPRLHALAASWPTEGWESLEVIARYRMAFLRALSAQRFADSAQ